MMYRQDSVDRLYISNTQSKGPISADTAKLCLFGFDLHKHDPVCVCKLSSYGTYEMFVEGLICDDCNSKLNEYYNRTLKGNKVSLGFEEFRNSITKNKLLYLELQVRECKHLSTEESTLLERRIGNRRIMDLSSESSSLRFLLERGFKIAASKRQAWFKYYVYVPNPKKWIGPDENVAIHKLGRGLPIADFENGRYVILHSDVGDANINFS